MTNNEAYWTERALKRAEEAYLHDAALTVKLFQEYESAAKAIKREISAFYSKYAGKYGLTYDQAVRLLNRKEFQEWKASLAEYVDYIATIQDPKVKALLTAQLDTLSANSSISRLEALQGQIDLILNDLFDKGVAQMKNQFGDDFVEGYYKKCYDLQSRAGFFNEIAKIDYATIENVVSYPWSGAMFSDRLWQNKQALLFNTREVLTQGLIQGKSVNVMSSALAARMGQSYKNAERLVRTETAHIHAESDRAAYKEAGVEQYEFMATLEVRTCDVCGSLDGKHFKVSEAKSGVNYPPIHPNCRCTTVEYDPDDALDWYNSGQPMPKTKTYEEWYDEQVARNGQGSVEVERQKVYNRKADLEQFEAYSERLGADAPSDVDTFQRLKYSKPDEWSDLKSLYSYKGRVPEATKADFQTYKKIKATGIYGTVRVPAAKIDTSALTLDVAHINERHHGVTQEEAVSYIKNAAFSLKRRHWTGETFLNYYSEEGASYVRTSDNVIRTSFKKDEFDKKTKSAMEVLKNGK